MPTRWPQDRKPRQRPQLERDPGKGRACVLAWRQAWLTLAGGMICGLLLVWWFHVISLHGSSPGVQAQPIITGESLADTASRVLWNALRSSLPVPQPGIQRLPPTPHVSVASRRLATMSNTVDSPPPTGHTVLASGWSVPDNLSSSEERSSRPRMVVTNAGVVHVVWEEGVRIYHSTRVQDAWSIPRFVATGESPSLALARDDSVHLVFANEFGGDFNVFYVVWRNGVWTLPRLVSKTSGLSASPSVALDSNQVVHAVWEDTTPGYPIIYHGWLDGTWLNEPLTNARGSAPVLSQDTESALLHLAWQARGPEDGPYDVYYSHGTTYGWSVPQNISVTRDYESANVRLACDLNGQVHLVWREQGTEVASIRYTGGRDGNWSAPENVSEDVADAFDHDVAVAQHNQLHVVWRENRTIVHRSLSGGTHKWRPKQAVIAGDSGMEQMALAAAPSGDVHLMWVGWGGGGQGDIFHSVGPRVLPPQVFLPSVPSSGL